MLKLKSKQIKFFGVLSFASIVVWISLQIKKTREILNGAFDPFILRVVEPKLIGETISDGDSSITLDSTHWIKSPTSDEPFYLTKWKSLKYAYALRLINLSEAENTFVRWNAVRQLSKIKDLDSWQFERLSNVCSAQTAVALARIEEADLRYQTQPFFGGTKATSDYLVGVLKEFLVHLDRQSQHPCLSNFLSESFSDFQDMSKSEFENYYDHTDHIVKYIKPTSDMLPMCLESILHHSAIEHYAKNIAEENGLYLLLEVYDRYKHVYEMNVALCTIIANLSIYPELSEELHKIGWISLLAKWAREKDTRLSVTASRALANLDRDDKLKSVYLRGVYSLHPTMRTNEPIKIDVVFVHGLLGGIFYTWRQRHRTNATLGIFESITGEPELWSLRRYYTGGDEAMSDYLERFEEHQRAEWEALGADFDLVSYDIPTAANVPDDAAFSCEARCAPARPPSSGPAPRTQCWPKDWLTADCEHLRVVGVNYDTSLSKWAGGRCPEESCKLSLDDRTDDLLMRLREAGVGDRPIVWVAHSMGGLIVKNLLVKAVESSREDYKDILRNSRGIVFYSTPHKGSKIANLNQPAALLVLPSVEVQELREESPNLSVIHSKFLEIVKANPMRIISLIETKSTVVTALKFNFLMVEPASGDPGVGEVFEVPLDHLGICKPINRESFLYQKVLRVVRAILEEETRKSEESFVECHTRDCDRDM